MIESFLVGSLITNVVLVGLLLFKIIENKKFVKYKEAVLSYGRLVQLLIKKHNETIDRKLLIEELIFGFSGHIKELDARKMFFGDQTFLNMLEHVNLLNDGINKFIPETEMFEEFEMIKNADEAIELLEEFNEIVEDENE